MGVGPRQVWKLVSVIIAFDLGQTKDTKLIYQADLVKTLAARGIAGSFPQ